MIEKQIDLSKYEDNFTKKEKLLRQIWQLCWCILFRPFALPIFRTWRNFVLKCFGANIHKSCIVYASARIWAPWNLEMGENSCIGRDVDCYNQAKITIGANTTISQKTYLCASSHDITDVRFSLVLKEIRIGDGVWVAADAFIGPGISIEDGAVVGARSAVFKNVEPWTVVGGNPAKIIKERKLYEK